MSLYCDALDVAGLFPVSNAAVSNTQVTRLVRMASAYVDNFTRRTFTLQSYTESAQMIVNKHGEIVGHARQWPIVSVSALSYQYRDSTNPPIILDPTLVDVDRPPARFFYWTGQGLPGNGFGVPGYINRYGPPVTMTYTYTAGYNPIPDDIKLATSLIVQGLLMFDINPAGATSISVSAEGGSNSLSLGKRSIYFDMAEQILQPYVAPGDA